MNTLIRALAIASLLASLSCAGIINGNSDLVTVNSVVPGGRIYVDGSARGIDAVTVDLKRGMKHVLRVEKDGYQPVEMQTSTSFDSTTLLGVFIDFGIITIPIDLLTGSAWAVSPTTYSLSPIPIEGASNSARVAPSGGDDSTIQ